MRLAFFLIIIQIVTFWYVLHINHQVEGFMTYYGEKFEPIN